MQGYNYIVSVTAVSGVVFRFARAYYVSADGLAYYPNITDVPSVTESVPQVGATGQATNSFSCSITNARGDYSSLLKSRSSDEFEDLVGGILYCSEISDIGVVSQIFVGKVVSITPNMNGGVPTIQIRADTDGADVLAELVPSSIAIPANMLANGDCTSDITQWEVKKDVGATVTLKYGSGGGADALSGYLVCTHISGGYSVIGGKHPQNCVIALGDPVGAAAFIRCNRAGRTGTIRVLDRDSVEVAIGTVTMTAADTWYHVKCSFVMATDNTLIQNAADFTVEVYASAGTASGDEIRIDHVRFTKPDNFPQDDTILYEEGQGRPIPYLFGGHRGHFACVPAVKDPKNAYFGHVVCADVTDYLLRVSINTLYGNDGALRVLLASDYTLDNTTYPGRVLAITRNNAYPSLHADAEAAEFNTDMSGVARHWRFRNGSLKDEITQLSLISTRGGILGEWTFTSGALTDSSGYGRTLKTIGGNAVNVDYRDSGCITQNSRRWMMDAGYTPVKLVLDAGSDSSYCNFTDTDSFHVKVLVSRSLFGTLEGWIVSKGYGTMKKWGLRFSRGVPIFELTTSLGAGTVTNMLSGTASLADGETHEVIISLYQPTDTATLWVDGKLVEMKVLSHTSGDGSTSNSGSLAILGFASIIDGFYADATLDYVAIFDRAYWGESQSDADDDAASYADGSEIKTDVGHSGVSVSAVSIASDAYVLKEDVPLGLIVTSSEDLVVLVWFKCGAACGSRKALISVQSAVGANDGYAMFCNSDGKVAFFVGDGTDTVTVTSTATYMDGEYHCLVGVLNRGDNTAKLYVDGVVVGSSSASAVGSLGISHSTFIEGFAGTEPNDRIFIDEIVLMNAVGCALTADQIRTHYMTATGNPARVIRNLLTNSVIGLKQTVDSVSFDAAEDVFEAAKIRFGACLIQQQEAGRVFDLMCSVYGAYIRKVGDSWEMGFGWLAESEATSNMMYGGNYANVSDVTSFERTASKDMPKSLSCKFRPAYDPLATNGLRLLLSTVERPVASGGITKSIIDLPYVRDPHVADRIAHFQTEWSKADRKATVQLTNDLRSVRAGDAALLTISELGYDGEAVRIQEVSRSDDVISAVVRDDSVGAFTYVPAAIPADSEVEIDPDYSTTYPPPPTDFYVISNRGSRTGTTIVVGWTPPEGNLASALVSKYHVYYAMPDDKAPDNLLGTGAANDGSFKRHISGWTAVADGGAVVTLAHSMVRGYGGKKGIMSVTHVSGTYAKVGASYEKTRAFPSGAHYTASAMVKAMTGAGRVVTMRIKDSAGAVLVTSDPKTLTNAEQWYKVECDTTLSGGAETVMTVEVYISSGAVSGEILYLDDVILHEDQGDDTNFDGDIVEVGELSSSTAIINPSVKGIQPGGTVYLWVKSVSKFGLESIAAGIKVTDPVAETTVYGPNTVIQIVAAHETSESAGGAEARVMSEGNYGHEDRIVSLEYATAPGSMRLDVLSATGFNGSTATFVAHLPFTPSFRAGHDVFIMVVHDGTMTTLTRDTTGTPNEVEFYLSGTDYRDVTYGTPPPATSKAWVLGIGDDDTSLGEESTPSTSATGGGVFIREVDLDLGVPYTAGQVAYSVPVVYPHSFPVNLVGSKFTCKVPPADGDVIVKLKQDGVEVATVTYALGSVATDPATMVCSAWSATSGDFEIVMPVVNDSAFEGLKAAMLGTKG